MLFSLKHIRPSLSTLAFICLSACSQTNISDETLITNDVKGNEVARAEEPAYKVRVETHGHPYYYSYKNATSILCAAISKAPETIEGYHPIHAINAFPSQNSSSLLRARAWAYNGRATPQQNLVNAINNTRPIWRPYYRYDYTERYVFKYCMPPEQKSVVTNYFNTMRACRSYNFSIRLEKTSGGMAIDGDNGRQCTTLSEQLIKINLQGYSPKNASIGQLGTTFTGGLLKTGDSGAMLKAMKNCDQQSKRFNMEYDKEHNQLTFSCI